MLGLLLLLQSCPAHLQGFETRPVHTPAGSGTAAAANIVYRSLDGGQTWQDISEGLPENINVWSVYANGENVYLCSQTGLYHSMKPPVLESWGREPMLDEQISEVFPGRKGLYASSFGVGFFQQVAGSDLWRPMHNTLKDRHIRFVLDLPDGAVLVACDSGIFKSTDDGETWAHVFDQYMIMSLAAEEGVVVASGVGGLLRSTDNGEHWENVLSEDGRAPKTAFLNGRFFAITRGWGSYEEVRNDPEHMANRLRVSADKGKTWQRIDQTLAAARLGNAVVADLSPVWTINDIKQAGPYLVCSLDTGIFRSSDQGKTWKLVLPVKSRMSFNLAVSGKVIYAVVGGGC